MVATWYPSLMTERHADRLRAYLDLACDVLDATREGEAGPMVPTWASWTRLASAVGVALVLVSCDGSDHRLVPIYGAPAPPPESNCTDGVDNNDDGLTDCEDFSCRDQCVLPEAGRCDDGYDNDHDGDIDGCDSECPNECYGRVITATGGTAPEGGAAGAMSVAKGGDGGRPTGANAVAAGGTGGSAANCDCAVGAYVPICGVDGETYDIACGANCAPVDVACLGECPCAASDDGCSVGCEAFPDGGSCESPTVEWVCDGTVAYSLFSEAGCEELPTDAIRFCCPAAFLSACLD